MQAVDQLLKVRQGTAELRQKISEVNIALQTRGNRLTEKVHDRVEIVLLGSMLMNCYPIAS